MKVKLTVSYDGTAYCGWQVQPQPECITVQQVLEDAIEQVTGQKVRVTGSGRTDAGVHAKGQVAHFDCDCSIPPERFYRALNIQLPPDVKVIKSEGVDKTFHACNNAKKKTYCYSCYVSEVDLPLKDRYSVNIERMPDIDKMRECACLLVGEHDFKCFNASKGGAKTTVRTIYSLDIVQDGMDIKFIVCGNGFLYNMVRIMVGTLLKVGYGKATKQDILTMLDTGKRELGGKTLLAKGLCLESVEY